MIFVVAKVVVAIVMLHVSLAQTSNFRCLRQHNTNITYWQDKFPWGDGTVTGKMSFIYMNKMMRFNVHTNKPQPTVAPLSGHLLLLIKGDEGLVTFRGTTVNELFHWHAGGAFIIHNIDAETGKLSTVKLGRETGRFFYKVTPGNYYATEIVGEDEEKFVLIGLTVTPFVGTKDSIIPKTRKELLDSFPQHREMIIKFTGNGI